MLSIYNEPRFHVGNMVSLCSYQLFLATEKLPLLTVMLPGVGLPE